MNFLTGLLISTNWKSDSYDIIFIIIDHFTKMVHYKLVKTTIDVANFIEIIIDIVLRYHGLSEFIMSNQGLVFISKFWSSLYYFFDIMQKLSTTFHLQIDRQTKRKNNTMVAYLRAFVN